MPPFTGQVKGEALAQCFLRIRMSGNSFGERFRITTFGEVMAWHWGPSLMAARRGWKSARRTCR